VIAIAAVSCTIIFGAIVARMFGLTRDFGFLTGCATGVCGAAAAMATSDVLAVALITKLLRVACLLPAVTVIAWWVARGGERAGDARPAPPVFLFGFLFLAC